MEGVAERDEMLVPATMVLELQKRAEAEGVTVEVVVDRALREGLRLLKR